MDRNTCKVSGPDTSEIHKTMIDLLKLSGALYIYRDGNSQYTDHAPFAMCPYQLDRKKYEELQSIQPIWGKLLVELSHDDQLIGRVFSQTAKIDGFVRELHGVYERTRLDQPEKPEFHIVRSDYMLDQQTQRCLMVEYNLIAVSMGCISDRVQHVSRTYLPTVLPSDYQKENFPEFHNAGIIGQGMVSALKASETRGLVVMVVAPQERNIFDQRAIEYELIKHGFETKRATIADLAANTKLDESTRTIRYGDQVVAMFYFRDGYEPQHYPNELAWKLRENIERSTAISVPTVAMQLVNFKRMQQELSEELLNKYIGKQETQRILACTARMWNFEDQSKHEQLISLSEDGKMVLKPNREGGGHNTYGKEVAIKLRELSPAERKEFVLMQRLYPKSLSNVLVKNEAAREQCCAISEISVYSSVLYHKKKLERNDTSGWLVRTKPISCDEGGVATGFSVLSSLYLRKQ